MIEDIPTALNALAREQAKCRILKDILVDLTICELEGWNKKDYIESLIKLLEECGVFLGRKCE